MIDYREQCGGSVADLTVFPASVGSDGSGGNIVIRQVVTHPDLRAARLQQWPQDGGGNGGVGGGA